MGKAHTSRILVDDLTSVRVEDEVDLFFSSKGFSASGCAGCDGGSSSGSTLEIAPRRDR